MRNTEEIEAHIAQLIEEVSLGQQAASSIRSDQRIIQDLGLDSLDYATVLLGCERWLGIKVGEDGVVWSSMQTVNQLAMFLHGHQR